MLATIRSPRFHNWPPAQSRLLALLDVQPGDESTSQDIGDRCLHGMSVVAYFNSV